MWYIFIYLKPFRIFLLNYLWRNTSFDTIQAKEGKFDRSGNKSASSLSREASPLPTWDVKMVVELIPAMHRSTGAINSCRIDKIKKRNGLDRWEVINDITALKEEDGLFSIWLIKERSHHRRIYSISRESSRICRFKLYYPLRKLTFVLKNNIMKTRQHITRPVKRETEISNIYLL